MARLGDGASEVHMMVLSRFLLKEGQDFGQRACRRGGIDAAQPSC